MNEPVWVTGIGVVSPLGASREGFRDALIGGQSAITVDPVFECAGCRSVLSARVSGFDPAEWIAPMKLRRMDATGPFALVSAQQAIDAAKYAIGAEGDDGAGVMFGTYSAGGHATNDYLTALFRGGPTCAPALLFNSTVGNAAAGLIGLELKLRGANATVSQKEASGLAAVATAVDLLRLHRADAIAAGGVDAIYDMFYKAHDRFRVMSTARAAGAEVAPFSRDRNGFILGEGGFSVWLERGDRWRDRGAGIYGEILGIGAGSSAVALNTWPDCPAPLVRTMRMALADGGLASSDVDVVYASANATKKLDLVEALALRQVFERSTPVVTSIKGALGESSASGVAALAAALLCGAAGRVPPIAGLSDPDSAAQDLNLALSSRHIPGPIALVNSFASGGALFCAVVRTMQ